jgi:pteridine reductase
VTGGAVRLGKELALTLARAGYDIALHYNASEQAADRTADLCRAAGVRCEIFRGDFRDANCIPGLMDDVAARFPHLDLLVNSASVYESNPIAKTTPDLLDRQWCVNFKAPFLLMKAFHLRVGRGAIVNVLDNKIAFNQFQYAAYLLSKKALAEATKMAALEFAPHIRVNGIAPGVVLPASTRDEAYLEWRKEAIPVGRMGDPDRLCQGFMALVSNDFINGQILFVDGGESGNFTGRNAPTFSGKPAAPSVDVVPVLELS